MNNLLETALNGMGLGTKVSDIEKMYEDHKQQGDEFAATLLLDLIIGLEDLRREETLQANTLSSLDTAMERFRANPTVHAAETLSRYGAEVEKHARAAHTEYVRVGKLWRLWVAASKNF